MYTNNYSKLSDIKRFIFALLYTYKKPNFLLVIKRRDGLAKYQRKRTNQLTLNVKIFVTMVKNAISSEGE